LRGTIAGLGAELSADGRSSNLPSIQVSFLFFVCLLSLFISSTDRDVTWVNPFNLGYPLLTHPSAHASLYLTHEPSFGPIFAYEPSFGPIFAYEPSFGPTTFACATQVRRGRQRGCHNRVRQPSVLPQIYLRRHQPRVGRASRVKRQTLVGAGTWGGVRYHG
jgi:hypothetical protein